ncbi:hypothetical protein PCANC_21482 [Puccinia coronata f. sp. avenae]|uniref:Uncharacterized protein n=1 Tax=Puccinia coronata f. sp. avenae TaxID=200324 RepID=A0A2N5U037_9BASI|nr:hypothetical protein PCANC_27684 [Puccinia coronata f. sp. avenae]PLW26448.1 hypothetical protein PCASD_23403 [Puccinia coronata f. sp. avenae]PLW31119.1 hypothetical protein PCANC_21482 [Puccinia coronata f. sp. avenae]
MTFKITRKTPKSTSPEASGSSDRAPGVSGVFKRHVKFLGPGIVASAAYYDPGNWATDLQAGSRFGNAHLFILLVAISVAVFLQILATRLGFISRKDIAQNCRDAVYSGEKYQTIKKWLLLYPLWLIYELGVLSADMGELLGSATALILLFPRLPPWVAVLLTFPEVFLALLFFRNGKQSKKSMQIFEIMITIVVMAVVVSALVLFFKVNPVIPQVFLGYLPSKKLVTGSAFYTAIGIIGATVGPHSLILGASMATQDRTSDETPEEKKPPNDGTIVYLNRGSGDLEKHPGEFIDPRAAPPIPLPPKLRTVRDCKSYLAHATFDIAASIFTLPLIVNSAILVIASTTFFYNKPAGPIIEEADLVAMHQLLKTQLGAGLATLFAVSLWLSGNAASLTITMAGQSLSSGFLNYQTSPLIRRLITRTLGIIPATIIAAISAQKGINDMLIATQVAISIVLPFAVIPLAYFSSKKTVMSIRVPPKVGRLFTEDESIMATKQAIQAPILSKINPFGKKLSQDKSTGIISGFNVSTLEGLHSFANHWAVRIIIVVIVLVILASNIYGIYQVATGS